MWLRLFSVLCLLGAIVGGATFYFPITGLGVSEAYGAAGIDGNTGANRNIMPHVLVACEKCQYSKEMDKPNCPRKMSRRLELK